MPPRSSWKGFVKLSLVSVPVKAYTANATGAEIRLNQLHKECHSQVKYKKVCPLHGELDAADIVSGYQYAKGQFVEIDPDELSKLRTESDKSVTIDGFLDPEKIDPVYYKGKTYYLIPDGPVGQKPYQLLHRGMSEKGLYGLAHVVLAGKEQLVLLRPLERVIAMTSLSYDNQVKKADLFEDEVVQADLSKEEQQLADTLIGASTIDDLDYTEYTDAYTENLTKLIEAKVEGKEIVTAPAAEEPQVINLMQALKESVQAAVGEGDGARPARKTQRKMAASARKSGASAKKRKKKSG